MVLNFHKAIIYLSLCFLISAYSCNLAATNRKFDKQLWLYENTMQYEYREEMVKDLMSNYKLKGMKYQDLISLLDEPNDSHFAISRKIFYTIRNYYGLGVDVREMKSLIFEFNSDSVVIDYIIKKG